MMQAQGENAARAEVLARISRSVGDHAATRETEYSAIPRLYIQRGNSETAALLNLLENRLRDYDAHVYRCTADGIAATIGVAMTARGKSRLLLPEKLPREWLSAAHCFPVVDGLTYEEINQAEGVITDCVAAIALTGTIILRHGAGEGRRALTLIPDYHLCVVLAEQVVETVPEGFARLQGLETLPITTVSGPSATADIEMSRVKGVHGPRFLDVILVS